MTTFVYTVLGIVVFVVFVSFVSKFCGFNQTGHEP